MPQVNEVGGKLKAKTKDRKEKEGEKAENLKRPGRPRRTESLGRSGERESMQKFVSGSQIQSRAANTRRLSDQEGEGTPVKRTANNHREATGETAVPMSGKEAKMRELEGRIAAMEQEMTK